VLLRCALCGFEFDGAQATCGHACPLAASCNLVRCPSCGYEFPPPRASFGWLRGLLGRPKPVTPAGATIPLPDLSEGDSAELVCLDGASAKRRNSLAVYGVAPGCQILLRRKRPEFVILVGETELALEESIARQFLVRKL
jgi:rubredoxin